VTRKLRRTRDFDLVLEIRNDRFIRPPRDSQRNWLLNRFVREAADDLQALDALASRFAPGLADSAPGRVSADRANADLADDDIMEDWQIPLMEAMSALVARPDAHLLEIGFGRGISSEAIQRRGAASHTIVECNEAVCRRFEAWRARYPERRIDLVRGLWQDAVPPLGLFDAIFFHTYALNDEESTELLSRSVTFAECFFETAAAHLREGGVFTYLTNEIDSIGRAHQRALLSRFTSFSVRVIPLEIPADVRDAWWADRMAVVAAVK
jgi:guanidinoacetate N-methyltransferase